MTRPIRVFIVDDEPLARKTIRILLEEDSEIDIVGEGAGEEALTEMETSGPDLLFLDIEMPGLNGLDLLDRLQPERLPAVIFVTAYDEHAIRAFEHHAFDYLLKPFDDTRFERTLRHAKEQMRLRDRGEASERVLEFLDKRPGGTIALRRLLVLHDGKLVVVPTAEIDWIEAADYYARIHAGTKSWLHRESLSQLERSAPKARQSLSPAA